MNSPRICNNRPLAAYALSFGTGILLGKHILGADAYLFAVGFALTALLLYLFRHPHTALLILFLTAGLLRIQLDYPTLPQPVQSCELSGRIASLPERGENSITFHLDNATKDGYPIAGKVLLRMPDKTGSLHFEYGDILHTTASLSLPKGAQYAGGMDMRFYYFSSGLTCEAFAFSGLVILEPGQPDFYGHLLLLREQTTSILTTLMGEENGALAAAMLHGDTNPISAQTIDDFRGSGIAHLLSVSGLHVSLLIAALLFLIRRLRPGVQLLIVAPFLVLYCLFAALAPATIRAALMALCMLGGRVLHRRNDPLTSLSATFLLILIVSPFSLFSVGFQLSFLAMLGLFLVYPPLHAQLVKRMPNALAEALGVSLAGQLATLPVATAYFNSIPLLSVLANMLVVPLSALAMLPSLLCLLFYPFLPALAHIIGGVSDVTLTLMRAVAAAAASAGQLSFPSPSFWACLAYFIVMFLISHDCFLKAKRKIAGIGCAVCLLLWALPFWLAPAQHITALPVAQGYAVHIKTQGTDTLLGDTLGLESGTVKKYIQYNGLQNPAFLHTDAQGATLQLGEHLLQFSPGCVQAGEACFVLEDTGQIRFTLQNNRLSFSAFADEARYAILMEDARVHIDLEGIWTTEHFLKN